jgi:hypothetical protein
VSDYLNEFGRLLDVRRETEFLQRIFSGCAMREDQASAAVHTGLRVSHGGRLGDMVARAFPRYSAAGKRIGFADRHREPGTRDELALRAC